MKAQALNVFLVDDYGIGALYLKEYLNKKFGSKINVSVFSDAESCLHMVDGGSHIIVLDYFLNNTGKSIKNGIRNFKTIKEYNDSIDVIMLSSNENIEIAIKNMQREARNYILKCERSWNQIKWFVDHSFTQPIITIAKEYKFKNYLLIFSLAFILIGAILFATFKLVMDQP